MITDGALILFQATEPGLSPNVFFLVDQSNSLTSSTNYTTLQYYWQFSEEHSFA